MNEPRLKTYVLGFAFDKYENVALIHKIKPDWQKGRINGIGGKVEPIEAPIEAMSREFKEETGMEINSDLWDSYAVMEINYRDPTGVPSNVWCFRAFVDRLTVRSATKEMVQVYNAHQLPALILPNLNWLIPLALDRDLLFASVAYK